MGGLKRQRIPLKRASEPERDKSHSRINIQTLGIGCGALCKQSQLSSCDQDSFLAVNKLESVSELRLVRVNSDRCTLPFLSCGQTWSVCVCVGHIVELKVTQVLRLEISITSEFKMNSSILRTEICLVLFACSHQPNVGLKGFSL